MKKLGIVLGVFVALFLSSCEKETLEDDAIIKVFGVDSTEIEIPGEQGC